MDVNQECRYEDGRGGERGEGGERGIVGWKGGGERELILADGQGLALRVSWCLGSRMSPVHNFGADPKEWK